MTILLGQSAPAATTLTALYTTPGCARTTVSMAPKGAADAVAHYLYYDTPIAANTTLNLTQLDIRLTETDELRVYAAATFNPFGTEML
jgi:hypothetical protein